MYALCAGVREWLSKWMEWVCTIICYFFGSINQQMLEFTISQSKKKNSQHHKTTAPDDTTAFFEYMNECTLSSTTIYLPVYNVYYASTWVSESNMPMKVYLFNFNHCSSNNWTFNEWNRERNDESKSKTQWCRPD